jgi:hypothetical protein
MALRASGLFNASSKTWFSGKETLSSSEWDGGRRVVAMNEEIDNQEKG